MLLLCDNVDLQIEYVGTLVSVAAAILSIAVAIKTLFGTVSGIEDFIKLVIRAMANA